MLALQSTLRELTDAPADMQLVATASAGLICVSVVLTGRPPVLDWVDREPWAFRTRLTGVLRMLKAATAGSPPPTATTAPPPPKGLRTRLEWVQQYPQVLESFLTDQDIGVRRSTRERYILAKSPAGTALLLGAHET